MAAKGRKLISLEIVVVVVVAAVVLQTELIGNEISGDSLPEKMCEPSET
jgi:hypothetical protein